MPGPEWTAPELDRIRTGIAGGETTEQIARALPLRTIHGVRCQMQKRGLTASYGLVPTLTRVVSDTPERVVLAAVEAEEQPIEDLWDWAVGQTSRAVSVGLTQGTGRVRLVTDQPIALSLSSDWHISTSGAMHLQALREYAEAIHDTPGAYAAAIGDMTDNPIKWEKEIPAVKDQIRLLDFLVSRFGDKLLWMTSGNHDDWTKAFAGIDALRWLAKDHRLLYAPDEMVCLIDLVDPASDDVTATYCIATRHKFYRHSNLNWSHGCWRWLEERIGQWPVGPDGGVQVPDVLAIGHNHSAEVAQRDYANKRIWAARMGPWQAVSAHGRQGGWIGCPPTAPTFLLYPHRAAPVLGFADYGQALAVLATERAAWATVPA